MLPLNIRVDRNWQPIGTPQNAIPDVQELISLGGGHYAPPPCKVGLKGFKLKFILAKNSDLNILPDKELQ